MIVPAAPERLTEMNIDVATTSPKAGECQRAPMMPTTTPQIPRGWWRSESGGAGAPTSARAAP